MSKSTATASRVIPASGPVSSRSSPSSPIDQRRFFPELGRPTTADMDRPAHWRRSARYRPAKGRAHALAIPGAGRIGQCRTQPGIEIRPGPSPCLGRRSRIGSPSPSGILPPKIPRLGRRCLRSCWRSESRGLPDFAARDWANARSTGVDPGGVASIKNMTASAASMAACVCSCHAAAQAFPVRSLQGPAVSIAVNVKISEAVLCAFAAGRA